MQLRSLTALINQILIFLTLTFKDQNSLPNRIRSIKKNIKTWKILCENGGTIFKCDISMILTPQRGHVLLRKCIPKPYVLQRPPTGFSRCIPLKSPFSTTNARRPIYIFHCHSVWITKKGCQIEFILFLLSILCYSLVYIDVACIEK